MPSCARTALGLVALVVGLLLGSLLYEPQLDTDALRGLRVAVTGATSGIGFEISKLYARHGANIVLVARNERKLREASETFFALGASKVDFVVADLSTDDDSVYAKVIADAVEKLGGGIDTLVLNHVSTSHNLVAQGWQAVRDMTVMRNLFETNTFSHMSLTHHALDPLAASGGNIIFVSSLTGRIGVPKGAAYAATKHAMQGFLKSLRLDLLLRSVPVDITTCTIGNIDTASNRDAVAGTKLTEIPREKPEDAARAIVVAGQRRVRETVFPVAAVASMIWLDQIAPSIAEKVLLHVYRE
ncbi:Hydroxysteroid 11-beta-dehydrogenase 1-like protein [Hondaea fermentalgiana]|uniref:Hydroxysteroid 11-beta-dehydrogenase 1-like protein n=1 Tax=Hondaea fermentalgiana TaxID=2315210 RepID=A0A2R5GC65_9STRA|nr:Hydroxysteroid 11-beta-dehydrogenase 1-like protein [Hondaea fermentalgiana]|eukprot:GBG25344.1 Hydroxysteroid 11-beta-dehydrogenase 1-like protein [Hondaea fermentalgiana]